MTDVAKDPDINHALRELAADEIDLVAGGWGAGTFFGVPSSPKATYGDTQIPHRLDKASIILF